MLKKLKEIHMKKILLALAFVGLSSPVKSGEVVSELIGPTSLSQSTILTTIAAPGAGYENCLTDVVAVSTHNFTLRILDSGTTVYAVDIATSTAYLPLRTAPYADKWTKDNPFCVTENSALRFTIINSTDSAAQYRLNYRGYIRKKK
jgi:hypothetical protein